MKKITLIILFLAILISTTIFIHYKNRQHEITTQTTQSSQIAQTPTFTPIIECPQLKNLPQDFYTTKNGYCEPTEKHYSQIYQITEQEVAAADKTVNAYIKDAYEKNGSLYVDIDDFEMYGYNAEQESKQCVYAPDAPEKETSDSGQPLCNPNGFAIVNKNNKVATYPLTPTTTIRLSEEFGNIPDYTPLNPIQFIRGVNQFGQKYYIFDNGDKEPYHPPFLLMFKNNKLTTIHQIYLP